MAVAEAPPPSYEEAVRPRTWEDTHPDQWTLDHAAEFLRYIRWGPNNFHYSYVPGMLGPVLKALRRYEPLLLFLAECPPASTMLLWWTHAGHCMIEGGTCAKEPWQRVPL